MTHGADRQERREGRVVDCYGWCDRKPCKCPPVVKRAKKRGSRQAAIREARAEAGP